MIATAWVLLSAIGFGSLALWAKLGFRAGIDPVTLLAARFTLAAPLLLAVCGLRDPKALRRPWRETAALLLQGAAGYGTPALLAFLAFRITSGAVVSALYFTFPIWVTLGAALLFREPVGIRPALALVLAVGGSALTAGLLDGGGEAPAAGVVFSLGAALAYATYVLSGQRLLARIDPLAVAGYSMLGCSLLFVAVRAVAGGPLPRAGPFLVTAALMAVAATALPLALLLSGMRRLGAARSAIVASGEPVFTALLLYAALGERLALSQAIGVGAIVAGVALVAGRAPDYR